MNDAAFLNLLSEVLELAPGTLSGDTVLESIEGWSSLSVIGVMAAVDETYGVKLEPAAIVRCKTVDDLLAMVRV